MVINGTDVKIKEGGPQTDGWTDLPSGFPTGQPQMRTLDDRATTTTSAARWLQLQTPPIGPQLAHMRHRRVQMIMTTVNENCNCTALPTVLG